MGRWVRETLLNVGLKRVAQLVAKARRLQKSLNFVLCIHICANTYLSGYADCPGPDGPHGWLSVSIWDEQSSRCPHA